ncbi:MAG: biopolymer transporter ExbD [Bacteroidales bacterium]|nr:biopolymer transporter ExbD [Bacteroidales bacterium]MDD2204506.1 biopolymer transporter ExbD [Bacteroidales bacterium]MDD3151428.1 biopolymer transporter ExbD [Bacteroidales bacterium]MDD3914620.1 biopolymer transporter ExbD [Bacteroidales bacterium]MDD4633811.1 biopolymer transporter ExbD [Bacteroidales bacterium]
MGKFVKKGKKEVPAISTSSMPDIVFMLIFFFMITTTMRQSDPLVKTSVPSASQVEKLEKKSLVSYIFIGPPKNAKLGTESRIQLNDSFATLDDIPNFIFAERDSRDEVDRKFLTTSIKADKTVKMGIINDVKQQLREVGAFKISYSSRKDVD